MSRISYLCGKEKYLCCEGHMWQNVLKDIVELYTIDRKRMLSTIWFCSQLVFTQRKLLGISKSIQNKDPQIQRMHMHTPLRSEF